MRQIVLLIILITSCKTLKNRNDLAHDAGKPVNSNSPYQWMILDRESFMSYMEESHIELGIRSNAALSKDHPSQQRIQYWVDQIDSYLRSNYPESMISSPKPEVLIVKNDVKNANVVAVSLCTGYSIAHPSHRPGTTPYLFSRHLGVAAPSSGPCIEATDSMKKDMQQRIRWHFSRLDQCKISFEKQKVILSEECGYRGEEENELRLHVVPSVFTVYTGLLLDFSEAEVLSVIAHELGHYYKAHTLQDKRLYNYAYRLGDHNPSSKPLPDPTLVDFQSQVESIIGAAEINLFQAIPGQRYHTGVFFFAGTLISLAKNIETVAACRQFIEAIVSLDQVAPYFLSSALPQTARGFYDNLESQLEPCFRDIRLLADTKIAAEWDTKGIPYFSMSAIVEATYRAAQENFPRLEEKVTFAYLQAPGISALDYIQNVQKTLASYKPYRRDDYAKVFNESIGIYTDEQEADDLAAEWVHNLGFDPQIVVDMQFSFLKIKETASALGQDELTSQACRALYENDWLSNEGLAVPIVGISDYNDKHHSSCFRIFNISREIEAHRFVNEKSRQAIVPEPSWNSVQESVRDYLATHK